MARSADLNDAELHKLSNVALGLLARREYSRGELVERLARRSNNEVLIGQVLDALVEQGLQSDQRFAENFVRYRIEQGKGPLKIRQDLRQKHIDSALIDATLDQEPEFWSDCAERVYTRKFGNKALDGDKDFARRLRFMVSRGFSAQQTYPLIERSKQAIGESELSYDF